MDHTAVDSNVNSGLWMTVTCQYRFTGCNKCTALMADVDHDGGYACVQSGRYMGNLCAFNSYCYEAKTTQKSLQLPKKKAI